MMDSNKVKNKLDVEKIIKLCCFLQGEDTYFYDAQGHPIFSTILDHEDSSGSFKLYYYPETRLFHVYTRGESYDVFEMVCRARHCDFAEALKFIVNFFHFKNSGFEEEEPHELTDDWDIFQRIRDFSAPATVAQKVEIIPENLLEYFFPLSAPIEWQRDGISPCVMKKYGIRVDSALDKIIIPHRNVEGKLIGIRGRSYNPIELSEGKKYMPVFVEGTMYRHPLGQNLYGAYENQNVIRRTKKAYIAEGEKSVLQSATMYGIDNCFAVAACGSSLSKEQVSLLLNLGVEEIILGFDREFDGGRGEPDTIEYEAKLLKIVSPFLPYVNVSVIMDYDHLLPEKKMSPTDAGKEIFEKLYHSRVRLYSYTEKIKGNGKRINGIY